jgi:hypothetical protein
MKPNALNKCPDGIRIWILILKQAIDAIGSSKLDYLIFDFLKESSHEIFLAVGTVLRDTNYCCGR